MGAEVAGVLELRLEVAAVVAMAVVVGTEIDGAAAVEAVDGNAGVTGTEGVRVLVAVAGNAVVLTAVVAGLIDEPNENAEVVAGVAGGAAVPVALALGVPKENGAADVAVVVTGLLLAPNIPLD